MSNALDAEEQQQIRTLDRLGWTLSRIQAATGFRRETINGYLKAAVIPVRRRGRPREGTANAANNNEEVSTDSSPPSIGGAPASAPARPGRSPTASVCEPYRELIVMALGPSRNAVLLICPVSLDRRYPL